MYISKVEMNTRDGSNVMKREECYYVLGPTGDRLSPCLPTLVAARQFQTNLANRPGPNSMPIGPRAITPTNPGPGIDGVSGGVGITNG